MTPLVAYAFAVASSVAVLSSQGPTASPRHDVERALEAMGSPDRLMFSAEGTRDQTAERQGRAPDVADRSPFRETIAFVEAGGRLAREHRYDRPDGTFEWLREIFEGEEDRKLLILQDGFAIWFRSPDSLEEKRKYARRLPHLLLAECLERPESLRREGPAAVSCVLSEGTRVTLRFDPDSSLLSGVEYVADVQSYGDVELSWAFSDWSTVAEGVQFPGRIEARVAGRSILELDITAVTVEREAADAFFSPPEGFVMPEEPRVLPAGSDPSAAAEVRRESLGVYSVRNLRGGFHPLFVELGDCVLAVDAPAGYRLLEQIPAGDVAAGATSDWLSERFLELIHETLPGKRVCWVALTHFHNDHGGGLRAFVSEGATLLVPPNDLAAVEALIDNPHTVAPDRLARMPTPANIEVVAERRSLEGGGRTVELIPIGSNPHTDDMLAVYLPDERFLFVSDLLTPVALDEFPTASHARLDLAFMDWLDGTDLDAERVYAMHGSGLATREHLDRLRGLPRVVTVVPDRAIAAAASDLPHVEPHLAMHPSDPRQMAVAAIVAAPTRAGPWTCAAFVTQDAGASFTRRDFDMESCIDPWAVFTSDGDVLVAAIEIARDRPESERFRLRLSQSEDGGSTWSSPVERGTGHDHELVRRMRDGSLVLVSRRARSGRESGPPHSVGVMRSDVGDADFRRLDDLRPSELPLNPTGLVELSDGTLVVSFLEHPPDDSGLDRGPARDPGAWVVRSSDGGESFSEPVLVTESCGPTEGFAGYPALAVGPADGAFADRLYHLCVRTAFEGLVLATSSDGGRTWAEPVHLGRRATPHARTPMLAVNRDGVVGAAWYGRTHPDARCQDLYFTTSVDGGRSFAEPVRASTATSCPQSGENGRVAESWPMGGDYGSLAVAPDGVFHVIWADSRSGRFQLHHAAMSVRIEGSSQ